MTLDTSIRARIVAGGLSLAVLAMGLALTGCQQEVGITQYTVPQPEAVVDPEHAWYIKLEGSPEAVEPLKEQFQEFVASVEVGKTAEWPPIWQLPEGWTETESESSVTYKAFDTGEGDVQCTVTVLPVNGGILNSLHGNYNRWLGQVGRPEVPGVNWLIDAQTAGQFETIEGTAGEVKLFDLQTEEDADEPKRLVTAVVFQQSGAVPVSEMPLATTEMPEGHPPVGEGTPPPTATGDPGELPMTFDVPTTWTEGMANTGFGQMKVWLVDVDGAEVKIAISHTGGDLTQNIVRWAGQAGVEIATEEDLTAAVERIDVGEQPAAKVHFAGEERSVGGVILASTAAQGFFWFFKIDGPTAAVEKIRPEFDAFIETVEFVE